MFGRDERITSFTSAIGKADRRFLIRLCLVVEPPFSEVRTQLHNPIKKGTTRVPFFIGRDERIRTSDFLHPMQALYQAELRPEHPFSI